MAASILLIDDDPTLTAMLRALLQSAGYEVHVATDAMVGVKMAHRILPRLILLDLKMPAGGGPGVLRNLNLSDYTKAIPVIVLTGHADTTMKNQLRAYDIKTYIQKPFESDELLAEIAKILPAPGVDGAA